MPDVRGVTGAILVGGESRRMGSPKHAICLADGRTMLEHVAATMTDVCDSLVLLGDVESSWPSVRDRRGGRGPLGGLEALLRSEHAEPFLVCPCDMPLVEAATLRRLVDASPDASIAVMSIEGKRLPFPMRLDRRVLPDVEAGLDGADASVRGLLARSNVVAIEASSSEAATLGNVNAMSDVADVNLRLQTR